MFAWKRKRPSKYNKQPGCAECHFEDICYKTGEQPHVNLCPHCSELWVSFAGIPSPIDDISGETDFVGDFEDPAEPILPVCHRDNGRAHNAGLCPNCSDDIEDWS